MAVTQILQDFALRLQRLPKDPRLLQPTASCLNQPTPLQINKRQPAAFRVLVCDELTRHIVRFLIGPDVDDIDEGRATLLSLATVCKSLSSLALEILWDRFDSIQPLASLYDMHRSEVPADPFAPRFIQYARYVRALQVESGTVPHQLLANPHPSLLPRLRRLHWVVPSRAALQPIAPFLAPCLSDLRIEISSGSKPHEDAAPMDFLLEALGTVTDRRIPLSSLEVIWFNVYPLPCAPAILEKLSSLTHLTSLSGSVDVILLPDTLNVLSKLPSLRTLNLSHYGESYDDSIEFKPVSTGFDALEELLLDCPSHLLHGIIGGIPPGVIRRCSISLQGSYPSSVQESIVTHVARTMQHSVDDLSLSFPGNVHIFRPGTYHTLSLDVIPTLRTMNFVNVSLAWVRPETITDGLCHDMAIAWPRLRVLHIRPVGMILEPSPEMVTLRGLRDLARGCPDLCDVVIQINASGEHWANESKASKWPGLQRPIFLDLTVSRVTSPLSVATYLRRCFPFLKALRFNEVEARMYKQYDMVIAWDQLRALLLLDNNE